ncbi:hypothetical protein PISL3812_00775 [Talaromyces islandicus]|uniref:Uncharacterized protein n=1 Tax=Talaromyces islandicus TaxID=28573 RepID=A0A0U1LK74_TALIS|nr:hypothetical protein PISL3812_00775 [Talaromyces islandicus]
MDNMLSLPHADSTTVDPHKAGYIPYPAGSLVYSDERMRFLVTWTSPYLSQGSSENIGVYGVEGSRCSDVDLALKQDHWAQFGWLWQIARGGGFYQCKNEQRPVENSTVSNVHPVYIKPLWEMCTALYEELNLDVCKQGLFVIRNVVMSPFPTDADFIRELMEKFQEIARKEVQVCRERNNRTAYKVEFVMAGTETLFLDFQASFHRATPKTIGSRTEK